MKHSDRKLFDRFGALCRELQLTASVVQNDHDRLISDGAITVSDVARNLEQFYERSERHILELMSLRLDVSERLLEVARAMDPGYQLEAFGGVAEIHYQFHIFDESGMEVAQGTAPTRELAEREGRHYLMMYQQDEPHSLEIHWVAVLGSSMQQGGSAMG